MPERKKKRPASWLLDLIRLSAVGPAQPGQAGPAAPGSWTGGVTPHWYWSVCGQCGGHTRAGMACWTCGWMYGAVDPAEFGLRAAAAGLLDEEPVGYEVAVAAAIHEGWLAATPDGVRVTEAGAVRLAQLKDTGKAGG